MLKLFRRHLQFPLSLAYDEFRLSKEFAGA